MPPRSVALPPSALRLRRLPLPSSSSPSHRRQPTRELARFEQVPQASRLLLPSLLGASAPALRLPARGGGQDPEIRSGRCLAAAAAVVPPRGRPGAIFGRPWYVFLSGLGFGCAARSEATFTCAAACAMGCEEGKERERWRRIVVALPYSPRLDESQSQRAPDIDSISCLPLPQSQRSRVAKVVCKCSFQKSKSRFCGRNDMTGWQDGVTSCSGVAATRGGRDG